jgi:hypothetical protein
MASPARDPTVVQIADEHLDKFAHRLVGAVVLVTGAFTTFLAFLTSADQWSHRRCEWYRAGGGFTMCEAWVRGHRAARFILAYTRRRAKIVIGDLDVKGGEDTCAQIISAGGCA